MGTWGLAQKETPCGEVALSPKSYDPSSPARGHEGNLVLESYSWESATAM